MSWVDPSKGLPIYRIYASSQMTTADDIASVLPDTDYIRVHQNAPGDSFKMDDISPSSLSGLQQQAQQTYKDHEQRIKTFLQKAAQRTDYSHVRITSWEPAASDAIPVPALE